MKKKAYRIALICGLGLCLIYALTGSTEETHKERIEKQFNPLNGEHINLTKALKANLSDPGNYKTINTTYTDLGKEILVSQTYTIGGVQHVVKATVDTIGNVISIK